MRNRLLYIACVLVMSGIPSASGVVVSDFGRYEIILQRRPFGEAPPSVNLAAPAAPVIPTGPSFADALTMCAITAGGGAIRVGFVDTKVRPPKTYFLFVGDSEDGIEVVEANYEEETVTLSKDGDTRQLQMGGGGGAVNGTRPVREESARHLIEGKGFKSSKVRAVSAVRKRRIEERKRRSLQLPELHGQVLEKYQREYNMEVIRQGAPPLPIPLTPEEDATLVAEGVLPPQAE